MKKMLIDANQENEVRVAIVESKDLLDFESESLKNERVKGNIYLAKIIRVEPSLQAAFVDYGAKKHGFLAYNEIHLTILKYQQLTKNFLNKKLKSLRIFKSMKKKTITFWERVLQYKNKKKQIMITYRKKWFFIKNF